MCVCVCVCVRACVRSCVRACVSVCVCRHGVYDQGIKVCILEPGYFKTDLLTLDTFINGFKRRHDTTPDEIIQPYRANFSLDSLSLAAYCIGFRGDRTLFVIVKCQWKIIRRQNNGKWGSLKENRSEYTSWPENLGRVQMFLSGSSCWFLQYWSVSMLLFSWLGFAWEMAL